MAKVLLSTILLFLATLSCGPDGAPPASQLSSGLSEAPYDAFSVHDATGALVESGIEYHPTDRAHPIQSQRRTLRTDLPQSIHPALQDLLASTADEVLEVILSVRTPFRLSFLPRYDRSQSADSAFNLEVLAERLLIQQADDELRAQDRAPVIQALEGLGGAAIEEFRVGNAVRASVPAGALRTLLATRPEIIAATTSVTGEKPAYYYIDDGRTRQKSDQMEAAGYDGTGYRIGLLDTGVYAGHDVFNSPDPINIWRDCVWTPMPDCSYYPYPPWMYYYYAGDPYLPSGHGTEMADIMVGNSDLGNHYRGVAPDATLDSVNVYSGLPHDTLSQEAVLRAFNYLDAYDDVMVVNVTAMESDGGTIALAADDVYDQGVVIIAPVGNDSATTAFSPARAHKVLGLGAYSAGTGNYWPGSAGSGDGRFKPDVSAPTIVYAAANTGHADVAGVEGTCPGASFAGGAAALIRDYYDYRGWSTDPGAINAAMITFGDRGGSSISNPYGAGRLEVGEVSNSTWYSGVEYLDPNEGYNKYFNVGSNTCDLRAGIWWAEDYSDSHNILHLRLFNPGGSEVAYSTHTNSVFQKVLYAGTMATGSWRLRIWSSINNTKYNLKVHYLIHMRTNCQ